MYFSIAILILLAATYARFRHMVAVPGRSDEPRWYHASNARWAFGIGAVVIAITFSIMAGITDRNEKSYSSPVPIKAIGTTMQTEGHYSSLFFIASGSVDSEPVYYYFRKNGEGFLLDHAPAATTTLIESDTEAPGIRRTCTTKDSSPWVPWARGGTSCSSISEYTDLDIVIPKGSIVADSYKVGLPK